MTKAPLRPARARSGPVGQPSARDAESAASAADLAAAGFDDYGDENEVDQGDHAEFEAEAPEQHNERRGRTSRVAAKQVERRRRRGGSLNVMAQLQMDCIPPECLDLHNYVYRWVNDERGKLRLATKLDDYDFVRISELGDGFDREAFDGESEERCRMTVQTLEHGRPLYAYLLKKPREFFDADQNEIVDRREAMMQGRIYRGDTTEAGEARPGGQDNFYIPSGATLGHAGQRRRSGPIQSSRLMKA